MASPVQGASLSCCLLPGTLHMGHDQTVQAQRLEAIFATGSKKGIQPDHAVKLQIQLATLEQATGPEDMNAPNWCLHALGSDLGGHWSIWVDGNWRLTFRFVGEDAESVDYQDYH